MSSTHLGPRQDFYYCHTVAGLLMCGALSDKRMGHLQLLLAFASTVILTPSFMGLMTIFHCLSFKTLPTWRARSPYLYPTGTGWPNYTPRHWVPFSSPPTTHRAIVEVFEPASTWRTRLTATANWSWLQHLSTDCAENISSIIALFSCCYGNMLDSGAVT
jgi:hypothetical protein